MKRVFYEHKLIEGPFGQLRMERTLLWNMECRPSELSCQFV